jgi:hypothetical protein
MKTATLPAANSHPPGTSRFRAIMYMLLMVLAYSAVTRLVLFGVSLPDADPIHTLQGASTSHPGLGATGPSGTQTGPWVNCWTR